MNGKLRNMTSIYIWYENKILLLYRQGGRVVNNVWTASAGGHFEENELINAKACVLREIEEEIGITEKELKNVEMRYVTLRRTNGEIRQNYYFFAELVILVHKRNDSLRDACCPHGIADKYRVVFGNIKVAFFQFG